VPPQLLLGDSGTSRWLDVCVRGESRTNVSMPHRMMGLTGLLSKVVFDWVQLGRMGVAEC
jgi:hypothetical protein